MQGSSDLAVLRAEVGEVHALLSARNGHIHMLGIGGVGMAGVAVHLQGRGFKVSGCDATLGSVTQWLGERGIPVAVGHDASHLAADVAWCVRSPAVRNDEPEVKAAMGRGLRVFRRGVVLPALLRDANAVAVSGTHGKTTTTTMIAHLLRTCGVDASYAVGGEADALGGVSVAGKDRAFVVEADESDGTLALYEPEIAVITNMELDHVDYFRDMQALRDCFATFAGQTRRRVICGADDPESFALSRRLHHALTFGMDERSNMRGVVRSEDAGGIRFEVQFRGAVLGSVSLPVPGRHNVLNALAALVVGTELGLRFDAMAAALASFSNARRRFEKIAEQSGVLVISDYAHHPTEIRALMTQAVLLGRRLVAVFQPHRYSRTLALGDAFARSFRGVQELLLVPVYAASEPEIKGGTSRDLMKYFERAGETPARYADSLDEAWDWIRSTVEPGDVLLIVGAGDVEKLAFRAKAALTSGTLFSG